MGLVGEPGGMMDEKVCQEAGSTAYWAHSGCHHDHPTISSLTAESLCPGVPWRGPSPSQAERSRRCTRPGLLWLLALFAVKSQCPSLAFHSLGALAWHFTSSLPGPCLFIHISAYTMPPDRVRLGGPFSERATFRVPSLPLSLLSFI